MLRLAWCDSVCSRVHSHRQHTARVMDIGSGAVRSNLIRRFRTAVSMSMHVWLQRGMRKPTTLKLGRQDVVIFHFSLSRSLNLINADGLWNSVGLVAAL